MASLRDRFWSRPVADAVTSPGSIVLAGAAAAVGIVATAPLALPVSLAVGALAAVGAYGARVLVAVPRDAARTSRIDPFAVGEPWRRVVTDALASRRRFDEAIRTMERGPVRSRLEQIGQRLDDGVQEVWDVARRGSSLVAARATIDVPATSRELAEARSRAGTTSDARAAAVVASLEAQLASAQRMDAVIEDTVSSLRLLDARLDEAVARAVELAAGASTPGGTTEVHGDVDGIVSEMEALRSALEEAAVAGGTSPPPAGPTSGTAGAQGEPAP